MILLWDIKLPPGYEYARETWRPVDIYIYIERDRNRKIVNLKRRGSI